jgi:hypothetical protein
MISRSKSQRQKDAKTNSFSTLKGEDNRCDTQVFYRILRQYQCNSTELPVVVSVTYNRSGLKRHLFMQVFGTAAEL